MKKSFKKVTLECPSGHHKEEKEIPYGMSLDASIKCPHCEKMLLETCSVSEEEIVTEDDIV